MHTLRTGSCTALLALSLSAVVGCSKSESQEGPADSRAAKIIAEATAPSAEVVARANDAKFAEFRALCARQREAADALSRYRASIGRHVSTAEQAAEMDRLWSALVPLEAELDAWFSRSDLDDLDRKALEHIHADVHKR